MKRRYLGIIKILIGLTILFSLIYKVGIKEIYIALLDFNFVYIPIVLLVIIFTFFLSALNYKILFSSLNMQISFKNLLRCNVLGWAIGLLLPGKLGEFSTIYFLRKDGIGFGRGSAVVILDKIISFLVTSLFTIAGFFSFFSKLQSLKLVIIIIVFFIVAAFIILSSKSRKIIRKFILRKYKKRFKGFYKTFFHFFKSDKNALFLNLLNTTLKWILTAFITYTLFLALNKHINFIDVLLITSIIAIISLIPITISGLGVRESSAVFFFALRGVNPAIVTSVYIILLVIKYALGFFVINTMLKEKHLKIT